MYVFDELVSPLVTPFILFFFLRNKASDIVDFLRNFTIEVSGVGDVCSFAEMNIKKHGCPEVQCVCGLVPLPPRLLLLVELQVTT